MDELFADSNKDVQWLNHLEHHTNFYINILKDRSGLDTSRLDDTFDFLTTQLKDFIILIDNTKTKLKSEDKLKPTEF